MAKSKTKSLDLLHEPAMKKVAGGDCRGFVDLLRGLAQQARDTNAGTASVTFDFINDGEEVVAQYVPQITFTIRELGD
jgi:hypothetical protein